MESGLPGMYASVNDVTHGSIDIPDYISAVGIQSIAFEQVMRKDVVTPYSTFTTILANKGVGLAWYANMLDGPKMQGPIGSTEAITINGSYISPLTTWDSKITTVVAILGGVDNINRRILNRLGFFSRFETLVRAMYEPVFPQLQGESIDFGFPTVPIPKNAPDFTTCKLSDRP